MNAETFVTCSPPAIFTIEGLNEPPLPPPAPPLAPLLPPPAPPLLVPDGLVVTVVVDTDEADVSDVFGIIVAGIEVKKDDEVDIEVDVELVVDIDVVAVTFVGGSITFAGGELGDITLAGSLLSVT